MGNNRPGPRVRTTIGGFMPLMAALFRSGAVAGSIGVSLAVTSTGLLSGCAHRDVVDTPVGWWHQLEGGAIADQRPPPPGMNDPYPKIGTTPAHKPDVASLDLRRSVTGNLLRQRNLTTRLDANDPIPPAIPGPAPMRVAPPGKPAPAGNSSATLDAAEAPPPPKAVQSASMAKAGQAASSSSDDEEPELAMPAIQLPPSDTSGVAVTMPSIPGAPPAPARLPGLALASFAPAPDHLPDYKLAPVTGVAIAFESGTDTMLGGQAGALHAFAVRRGDATILVHGYGDATAPDPDSQAQALSVAALRARTVAEALEAEGTPASSILLKAEAFGRGASMSLVQ